MRSFNKLDITHRENIFQRNCQSFNKKCSLIVDSGSSYNFCSTWLVKMLKLNSDVYPKPLKLSWIQSTSPKLLHLFYLQDFQWR